MTDRWVRCPAPCARAENGSASVLGIAIIGALVTVLVMVLPFYMALSLRQAVSGAADAAALAAADVAVGWFPGVPCEVAATVAKANGAILTGCAFDGLVVTVSTNRPFFGLELRARATAGPPGSEVD